MDRENGEAGHMREKNEAETQKSAAIKNGEQMFQYACTEGFPMCWIFSAKTRIIPGKLG